MIFYYIGPSWRKGTASACKGDGLWFQFPLQEIQLFPFHFINFGNYENAALSFATRHAMPQKKAENRDGESRN